MPYHTSGSMSRSFGGGYGTIKIYLQNTGGLTQGQEYPYRVQGQPQENTATVDRIEGRLVLVDSNYTIGENSPPFSAGMGLTVFIPSMNIPLLTTIITDIKPLEQESKETDDVVGEQITMNLYDGDNVRTFRLTEEMSVEEFMSTVLKDVPIEAIEELNSNNEIVSSYEPPQGEPQQTKTVKRKSQNKKKKKKGRFKKRRKSGMSAFQAQLPGDNSGRTY